MSKGARRKRQSRPWQNQEALRDIAHLTSNQGVDEELQLSGYDVSEVPSHRAEKEYLCPDCGNMTEEGEPHVVVYPEGDPDLRRHWHRHCWRLEVRRSTGVA